LFGLSRYYCPTNKTNVERKVSMSENKNEPVAPKYNISVTRNDVTLSDEIIPFKRLKGDKANTFYPAIDLTLENKEKVFEWLGDGNLINIVRKALKATAQSIAGDSIDADGRFDEALFAKYLTDFSSAGLKLKEINDLIDELQALAIQMIEKGHAVIDGVKQEAIVNGKFSPALMKLNDDIRAYRQMREDKQRTPKKEEEEVPSVAA